MIMSRFRMLNQSFLGRAGSIAAAGYLLVACGGDDNLMLEEPVYNPYDLRTTEIIGEERATFGEATFVGDLDADGYADFVLLARAGVDDPKGIGNAYLFYGRPEVPDRLQASDADLVLHGVGDSIAALGDVDADGYPDFAFMASCEDSDCVDTNGLHLFYGGEERYDGEFDSNELGLTWTLEPDYARYHSVRAGGDVNGDGHADLLLQATLDPNQADPPRAGYLLLGRADRDEQMPEGIAFDAGFQASDGDVELRGFTSPGDLDGDGFSEILAETVNLRFSDEEQSSLWLFYGAEDIASKSLEPSVADASFEWSEEEALARIDDRAGGLGDLNDDGYADFALLLMETEYEVKGDETYVYDTEVIHVIEGSSQRFEGPQDLSASTWSIETATATASQFASGDIDADGRLDLVIGDWQNDEMAYNGGAVLSSMAAGYEPSGRRQLSEANVLHYGRKHASGSHDWLGASISTGDVDGDGFDDILAACPGDFHGDPEGGLVLLIFGQASTEEE